MHLVKMACELPEEQGRSLSLWTCAELSRSHREAGIVESISPQSVQRILASHKLKPWRVHYWLSPKAPRDEAFRAQVLGICLLYTRLLGEHERVLSLDEKTSLQPRTRSSGTRPPPPALLPARLEHEYTRKGALNLFAAFDTRTGEVMGILRRRKRQVEQWFSILQRKRMVAPNFQDLADLEAKIKAFVVEWNEVAHPFNWTRQSFEKVLTKVDAAIEAAA